MPYLVVVLLLHRDNGKSDCQAQAICLASAVWCVVFGSGGNVSVAADHPVGAVWVTDAALCLGNGLVRLGSCTASLAKQAWLRSFAQSVSAAQVHGTAAAPGTAAASYMQRTSKQQSPGALLQFQTRTTMLKLSQAGRARRVLMLCKVILYSV